MVLTTGYSPTRKSRPSGVGDCRLYHLSVLTKHGNSFLRESPAKDCHTPLPNVSADMSPKVWIGITICLLVGLIWVAGQDQNDPLQIRATQYRNYQLVYEQQRRVSGWRQYYVNRFPYEYLVPIYFLILLMLRTSTTSTSTETCASFPAATSLGVYCCGDYTTETECQATPQNSECTWDTGVCKYECISFASDQTKCEGLGCTFTNILTGLCTG